MIKVRDILSTENPLFILEFKYLKFSLGKIKYTRIPSREALWKQLGNRLEVLAVSYQIGNNYALTCKQRNQSTYSLPLQPFRPYNSTLAAQNTHDDCSANCDTSYSNFPWEHNPFQIQPKWNMHSESLKIFEPDFFDVGRQKITSPSDFQRLA